MVPQVLVWKTPLGTIDNGTVATATATLCEQTFKVCSHLGCARFPEFLQNFSEHQILWSLSSVDFYTFTLQLPIETSLSGAPELQVFMSLLQNSQNFSKTSTPQSGNCNGNGNIINWISL